MYDLPPRRRISLILVKLGPAHQYLDVYIVCVAVNGRDDVFLMVYDIY